MSMDQNTINSANRPITSGNSFQINTLTPFIGDGEFTDRGQINLKGKGSFKTFFLESLNK